MPISSLLAAVVMAAAAQASSVEPTPVEAAAPVASATVGSADADDKMVCRRERAIGSNMMTRDCRTVGQRRKEAADAREVLQNGRSVDDIELGSR